MLMNIHLINNNNSILMKPIFRIYAPLFVGFIVLISAICTGQTNYSTAEYGGTAISKTFVNYLEKELGSTMQLNEKSAKATYGQHLINEYYYSQLSKKADSFERNNIPDSLFFYANKLIKMFPNQHLGYYYLAKFYINNKQHSKGLKTIEEAVRMGADANSFSYLNQLYSSDSTFINGYAELLKSYNRNTSNTTEDNCIKAIVDSLKYLDQLYRRPHLLPTHPLALKQDTIDSTNAIVYKNLVARKGWITKYLDKGYFDPFPPVVHFKINDQLFFMQFIIEDCEKQQAQWAEAESIMFMMASTSSRIKVGDDLYHAIPLIYLDSTTKTIDLAKSLLGIKGSAEAFLTNKPITIIPTSLHPAKNIEQNLEMLRNYFLMLGFKENLVQVSSKTLDKNIESKLPHIPLFVVKR